MKKAVLAVLAVLVIATAAQAKNQVYGDKNSSLESEGYKLFISDKILNTVEKIGPGADTSAVCTGADENTSKQIGDISAVRSDNRLSLAANAKTSYSKACYTYYSVLNHLKTADDVRKLWLLFADSATDDYAVETLKNTGSAEDAGVLIEMKRLGVVSKYIEFFLGKNNEWKLTDYTFLSQAFKARKDKPLSPAFSQFIAGLLTGDAEQAFQAVKAVDLDNLGARFIAPTSGGMEIKEQTKAAGKPVAVKSDL